jgi:hypothetical protein
MKKPVNFEKIKNMTFTHSGVEYRLNIRTNMKDITEVWILPSDKVRNGFTHVMLFTIDWNKGMTSFLFPKMGAGIKSCLPSTPNHIVPIRESDIQSINRFIVWCSYCVDNFSKLIKK